MIALGFRRSAITHFDEDHGVVERETYHRASSGSFIIISKRNLLNKSVKRSTWFLCHFYGNIHRTPTLKTIKLPKSIFYFSVSGLFGYLGYRSSFVYLKKRGANICRMTSSFPILAIRGVPCDHDTQTCCLGSMLYYFSIFHFYH